MATYEARLTGAGFLGDLEVVAENGQVRFHGLRAPRGWVRMRAVTQWLLFVLGLALWLMGAEWAFVLILAAPVFSLVAYLALWWFSSEQTVAIESGPLTDAATGWRFRWYDVFWLMNFLTAISLLFTAWSNGRKTVSFDGPSSADETLGTRYVVMAADAGAAAALTSSLLGVDGSLSPAPVGRTRAST